MEIKGYVSIRVQFGSEDAFPVAFNAESTDPREFMERQFKAMDRALDHADAKLIERFPELRPTHPDHAVQALETAELAPDEDDAVIDPGDGQKGVVTPLSQLAGLFPADTASDTPAQPAVSPAGYALGVP